MGWHGQSSTDLHPANHFPLLFKFVSCSGLQIKLINRARAGPGFNTRSLGPILPLVTTPPTYRESPTKLPEGHGQRHKRHVDWLGKLSCTLKSIALVRNSTARMKTNLLMGTIWINSRAIQFIRKPSRHEVYQWAFFTNLYSWPVHHVAMHTMCNKPLAVSPCGICVYLPNQTQVFQGRQCSILRKKINWKGARVQTIIYSTFWNYFTILHTSVISNS